MLATECERTASGTADAVRSDANTILNVGSNVLARVIADVPSVYGRERIEVKLPLPISQSQKIRCILEAWRGAK